jgi:hypothetical protein
VATIITIIIIMTTAMAMPAIVAHATNVAAMATKTTTAILLVILSKERPLTFMILFMMSDYPTATMIFSPRQQKKLPNMCQSGHG